MKISSQVNRMDQGVVRPFRCNNEKCWLHAGIITVTMMTGFTLSTAIASAQMTSTNSVSTVQTVQKSTTEDTSTVDATQVQSSKSVASGSTSETVIKPASENNSAASQTSSSEKSASSNVIRNPSENKTESTNGTISTASSETSSIDDTAVKSSQPTQTNKTSKINDDSDLKNFGVDVDKLNSNNVLKVASLFHIFAKQASLNADTNGNLAVETLKKANDFGTRGTSDNLTKGDIYYIQQLDSNLISNAFRNSTFNHVLLGKGIQVATDTNNKVTINGVRIDNLKPGEVSQDANGETYIDFDQVFADLIKESTDFSNQTDSDGVKKDFSDQNQRYVDVTNATSSNGIIYVSVPVSNLSAPQAFTIKGISSLKDGATIVINVTDIPTQGVQDISTQIQLDYSDGAKKINNSESHSEPNHVLWNLGNGNQTFNFNSGRFMGSILAPNATINAGVNIDGNIVANTVNIAGGESHRWDIQPRTVTDNPQGEVPDGIRAYFKAGVPTDGVPHTYVQGAVPDGIQAYFKSEVPTQNVPYTYAQGAVPDGIQAYFKSEVPTGNVPHTYVQGAVPDGIQAYFKADSPTDSVPHTYVQGDVPDGIRAYFKAGSPTDSVPHTYVQGAVPDGIRAYFKAGSPTDSVPHTYVQGAVPDGIRAYFKSEVPTENVPHAYPQGEVPDGIRVYFRAEVPTENVPHTTVPNVPTQPTTPSQPQPAQPTTPSTPQPAQPVQPVQPTTPLQPKPGKVITTGVDGDRSQSIIKAHEQSKNEHLISEDSEAAPQAAAESENKVSNDGYLVSKSSDIRRQSKPSGPQTHMPQLNEVSEKPVSILGYSLLILSSLVKWMTFRKKRDK
ncbi:collagen-binding domain-containing protein [Secundilactobacillus yichangensis]|uniref:collagen-binding domain-containing protein n=1 Tax=Secundilactobacillus yichangensis TaxID=2799580 RepID=UPI001943F23D|nr:collagen-binding domain-containing protein [Secundilactobacillus yichangensis]